MRRRLFPLFALFCVLAIPAKAQELRCSVSVNYSNLGGTEYQYLNELRQVVTEYINQRAWTEDKFEDFERIDCSMQLIMLEAISLTSFRARLVVASRRPIYGTAQQSTVAQIADEELRFEFAQGTPLVFEPDRYHPLTSALNFYAYLVLGFDYDTFSPLGGTEHFTKARRIAEIAQATGAAGWQALSGDRSRGQLIQEILDPRYESLRAAYYDYHFECLDRFTQNTDQARAAALEVLGTIQQLFDGTNRAYFMDQFFSAKYQEITAVFQGAPNANRAFDIVSQIDPAHLTEYNQMLQ